MSGLDNTLSSAIINDQEEELIADTIFTIVYQRFSDLMNSNRDIIFESEDVDFYFIHEEIPNSDELDFFENKSKSYPALVFARIFNHIAVRNIYDMNLSWDQLENVQYFLNKFRDDPVVWIFNTSY